MSSRSRPGAQQGFRQFVVEVDGALLDHILSRCDPQFGARDIQRQVELVVGKALADAFPGAGTAWRQAESLWLGTEEGIVIAKFE